MQAAWHFANPTIDDADHALLVTDHPQQGQIDTAILLLDDPGVMAEVHRLRVLDAEDRVANQIELHHILETPLGPQRRTIEQQERDVRLMEEQITRQERRAAVLAHLVAAAVMSRIIFIFHGIYGKDSGMYPPGLYLTCGQPATHTLTRVGDVPQVLPIYVLPANPPRPVRPRHGTPPSLPSPAALNDGSTLFKDNVDGEA